MRFHRIRLWLNSKREQRNLRRDQKILQSLSNMYSSVSESLAAKDIVINNLRMIDDKCPEMKEKIALIDSEKLKGELSAEMKKIEKKPIYYHLLINLKNLVSNSPAPNSSP